MTEETYTLNLSVVTGMQTDVWLPCQIGILTRKCVVSTRSHTALDTTPHSKETIRRTGIHYFRLVSLFPHCCGHNGANASYNFLYHFSDAYCRNFTENGDMDSGVEYSS